jgi:GDP-D-mannose 3',5'-epimerase
MKSRKKALVCGAGGFIGSHLVNRLKEEGYQVWGIDLKYPEFSETSADEFIIGDLRDPMVCRSILDQPFDQVFQLAADMGGAGYIFSGDNDAAIMLNSGLINLNVLNAIDKDKANKLFFSSSACVYPQHSQMDCANPQTAEDTAYPAHPDSDYGWEKLYSERLYLALNRNNGIDVRIARFHNVFGPEGVWQGGREKAPAAICRKVAEAVDKGTIDIWGDGHQTRSFLYIDECLEGIHRLMESDFPGPLNIGSSEMVTINQLAKMVMDISGKKLQINHIPGPQGVRGRSSDNTLIQKMLGWEPTAPLLTGLNKTYQWIQSQVLKKKP